MIEPSPPVAASLPAIVEGRPTTEHVRTIVPGMIKRRQSFHHDDHARARPVKEEWELSTLFWIAAAIATVWLAGLSYSVISMARENARLKRELDGMRDPALVMAEQAVEPYIKAVRTRGQQIRRRLLTFPAVAYAVGICAPYLGQVVVLAPILEAISSAVAASLRFIVPMLRKGQNAYTIVWWGFKARQVRRYRSAGTAVTAPAALKQPVVDGYDPAVILQEAGSIVNRSRDRLSRAIRGLADRFGWGRRKPPT